MVTCVNKTDYYEYYGLSTDEKPSKAPNGSSWVEMDTGKIYFFSEDGQTWYEFGGASS